MPQVSQPELVAGALAGKVVSFPTDTVPALAALPTSAALIFATKQRPAKKPLILMAASAADCWPYVTGTAAELAIWQQIARQYWPGQLTLVLPASARVPAAINPSDLNTIGLRVPNSEVARAILSQTGPLATTSANLSGELPLVTMSAIAAAFPAVLTLDDTELGASGTKGGSGLPSTVARWTDKGWEILRQGEVEIMNYEL